MIYETQCNSCKVKSEILLSIKSHDLLNDGKVLCSYCGTGILKQIISVPKHLFMRSPFPIGMSENPFPNPVDIKSKQHVKDLCQEHGLVSKRLENDTI